MQTPGRCARRADGGETVCSAGPRIPNDASPCIGALCSPECSLEKLASTMMHAMCLTQAHEADWPSFVLCDIRTATQSGWRCVMRQGIEVSVGGGAKVKEGAKEKEEQSTQLASHDKRKRQDRGGQEWRDGKNWGTLGYSEGTVQQASQRGILYRAAAAANDIQQAEGRSLCEGGSLQERILRGRGEARGFTPRPRPGARPREPPPAPRRRWQPPAPAALLPAAPPGGAWRRSAGGT